MTVVSVDVSQSRSKGTGGIKWRYAYSHRPIDSENAGMFNTNNLWGFIHED